MKTCGNRNYRKWLALMVSGGLAVTALAGCGGSDGGTEQSAQTEVSEGIKTAAFAFGGENRQIGLLEADGIEVKDGCVDLSKYQWRKEIF